MNEGFPSEQAFVGEASACVSPLPESPGPAWRLDVLQRSEASHPLWRLRQMCQRFGLPGCCALAPPGGGSVGDSSSSDDDDDFCCYSSSSSAGSFLQPSLAVTVVSNPPDNMLLLLLYVIRMSCRTCPGPTAASSCCSRPQPRPFNSVKTQSRQPDGPDRWLTDSSSSSSAVCCGGAWPDL